MFLKVLDEKGRAYERCYNFERENYLCNREVEILKNWLLRLIVICVIDIKILKL